MFHSMLLSKQTKQNEKGKKVPGREEATASYSEASSSQFSISD